MNFFKIQYNKYVFLLFPNLISRIILIFNRFKSSLSISIEILVSSEIIDESSTDSKNKIIFSSKTNKIEKAEYKEYFIELLESQKIYPSNY